ncbi:MAG: PQQ-dependent sugar dehydrogenase [Alphaproteobacteria bacterium]
MQRGFVSLTFIVLMALVSPSATLAVEPIVGPKPQTVDDVFIPAPIDIGVENWITGLEAPWSLVFLPDGRALVSERPGRVRLIRDGQLAPEPYAVFETTRGASGVGDFFLNLFARGEGGLMGLAVHPDFPKAPYIYAMYTWRGQSGVRNRIVRLRDHGDYGTFDKIILGGVPGALFHNGGRIAFGPDGMLYATTGEIFERRMAQDLKALGGKILRVDPEGNIPADNPFPGSPVWSYGHRNPQGLAWHPETGQLFQSEHGPSGEVGFGAHDEINIIEKGRNYGWPLIVGAPGKAPYADPIVMWPENSVPPTGIAFHQGDLYIATLRSEALIRLKLLRSGRRFSVTAIERLFAENEDDGVRGRLRDAVSGPDGALYVLTSNRDGRGSPRHGDDKILRLWVAK